MHNIIGQAKPKPVGRRAFSTFSMALSWDRPPPEGLRPGGPGTLGSSLWASGWSEFTSGLLHHIGARPRAGKKHLRRNSKAASLRLHAHANGMASADHDSSCALARPSSAAPEPAASLPITIPRAGNFAVPAAEICADG